MMRGFQYFLKSSVVMLWTESKQVWRSADDGSTWKRIVLDAGAIYGLFIHDENEKQVYLFTAKALLVSHNNGETFESRNLPAPPNQFGFLLVDFHPDNDKYDWMLYIGQKDNECFTTLHRTQDAGKSWNEVDTWFDKAVYASNRKLVLPDNGVFFLAWKELIPQNTCQDYITSTEARLLRMEYMLDSDQKKSVSSFSTMSFNSMWWNNTS
ncbi:MAG: hypothetical protein J3Q66DRAFT_320788, partial [Benniella sp.]